jgi:hypothetical protein
MTAHLVHVGKRKFQGWCEEHKDGLNTTSRRAAENWIDQHNDDEHPDVDGAPQTQEEVTRGALDAEEARLGREETEWLP